MFRKMPFILLLIILMAIGIQPFIPLSFQEALYALSLLIKNVIVFFLPLVIFSMLFKAAVGLAKTASKIILSIFFAIFVSNFLSTILSYGVGQMAYQLKWSVSSPEYMQSLEPLWQFSLPKWVGNGTAMMIGLVGGVVLKLLKPIYADKCAHYLDQLVACLLKIFLSLVPFFIFGFVIKMVHDGIMINIIRSYAWICLIIAIAVFSYITFIYALANRFYWKNSLRSMNNMFPALASAFGSMSSAASMPMTLLAAEKNNKNSELAKFITAATVNVHLIGDCFAIPIFAFAIMKSFGFAEPSLIAYLTFALYFVFAKFSVAAVPGGGILVMLPILESTLNFNAEMLSLITALYFLFDPIITSANVFGNGGFTMLMSRLLGGIDVKCNS